MGGGNLTAVFCDTGWEHPDTYKHVNDVCLQMGVKLITLKSKYDFVSLAAHKKRFPSTNPLYYRGFSRVGCFPCIMCRHKEIELIAKNDPEMCQRLIQAEKSVGHSFFPPSYIPQRFCKNKQYPYVEEVLEYVKEHTPDMFEPEGGYACMSLFHGLCE